MKARVVVAEDDPNQADLLRRYLEHEGHAVALAADGAEALDVVKQFDPDVVVLDLMLPYVDGFEVCRRVRERSEVAIIMVTARTADDDKVRGLDAGADDYLTKPYSPRELVARVRAMLRRSNGEHRRTSLLEVGDLCLDRAGRTVTVRGVPVELTPTELAILETLLVTPGQAFSRRMLLDRALGYDRDVFERVVDMHVSNLRRKIEDDAAAPRYVLTVKGVGYKAASRTVNSEP